VTGPTGSGKTTTLYAGLEELNRPDRKIITAEDPVEYNFRGMNQCQVRGEIGLSFARILRAMLGQAPNIILVSEIRDLEVGEVAIQVALTGHPVFSTLHTNDAPSAITRPLFRTKRRLARRPALSAGFAGPWREEPICRQTISRSSNFALTGGPRVTCRTHGGAPPASP
jgi:Tfp pilus assembly pilus retraction ATPase PilT